MEKLRNVNARRMSGLSFKRVSGPGLIGRGFIKVGAGMFCIPVGGFIL